MRRSNPAFFARDKEESWIASRSLSSGAHSRDPLARNDVQQHSRGAMRPGFAFILCPEGAGNAGRSMHPQPCVQK
jgi:hypothetical protein